MYEISQYEFPVNTVFLSYFINDNREGLTDEEVKLSEYFNDVFSYPRPGHWSSSYDDFADFGECFVTGELGDVGYIQWVPLKLTEAPDHSGKDISHESKELCL